MARPLSLFQITFFALLSTVSCYQYNSSPHNGSFTKSHISSLKLRTRELFDHGWNAYMKNGYPADELRPLTCAGYERVGDIHDINRNDVLGNYSVTFLDTITTFAIMNDIDTFSENIETLRSSLTFDLDSTVQVFETTIRALGSLLSAHLYASDKFKLPNYDGFLLDIAKDLGDRLLVSYRNENELPYARVNLRHGVNGLPNALIKETCTAGATSPMLELTLLSVLTNDPKYENYSKKTFLRLWNSRSKLNLLPMSLDPVNAKWLDAVTGIGASIDSFYEYALKGAILFDDEELLSIWKDAYNSLLMHSKLEWFFANVQVESGIIINPWIDSLSAFFPGVLVLAGEIETAIQIHQPFIKLWNKYGGIPERWDYLSSKQNGFSTGDVEPVTLEWYPLRPEFIESTYYLYQSTKDPLFLRIGEKILQDFEDVFKVDCGFSGYSDIIIGERQDRMESFVLSETLMYLYLLFDEDNDLNRDLNFIFSTEGHPLWIPKNVLKNYKEEKFLSSIDFSSELNVTDLIINENAITTLLNKLRSWPQDELQSALNYINSIFSNDSESSNLMDKLDTELDHLLGQHQQEEKTEDVCQVFVDGDTFYSALLSDPNLFMLDSKFHQQWKNVKDSDTIELEPIFYSIFADPNAISAREPSVNIWDFSIGGATNVSVPIKQHGLYDLWVDSIEGMRLKLEVLELNKVDFSNRLIDSEFLSLFKDDSIEKASETTCGVNEVIQSVLRVRTINGINVDTNSTIYISRANLNYKLLETKSIGISKKGHLVLSNYLVSNMKLGEENY